MTLTLTSLISLSGLQSRNGRHTIDQSFTGNRLAVNLGINPNLDRVNTIIGVITQHYQGVRADYQIRASQSVLTLHLPQTDFLSFFPISSLYDEYGLDLAYTNVGESMSETVVYALPENIAQLPNRVTSLETDTGILESDVDTLQSKVEALETQSISVAWNDVTGKPSTFNPSTHAHEISDVNGLSLNLGSIADELTGHDSRISTLESTTVTATWETLTGKPTSFPPSAHEHSISEVSLLLPELNSINTDVANLTDRVEALESATPSVTFPQKVKLNGTGNRGLFWYLGTLGTDDGFINPITRGSITGLMSTTLASTTGADVAIDRLTFNTAHSVDTANSWMGYDLGSNRSLLVDRYLIRSRPDFNGQHPSTWVLEGTNSVSANTVAAWNAATWETIDAQTGFTGFNGIDVNNSFVARKDTYYRYIRLRQTGANTSGSNFLTLGAIEFFGVLNLTA